MQSHFLSQLFFLFLVHLPLSCHHPPHHHHQLRLCSKNKNSTHTRSHLLFSLQSATSLHAVRPYITPVQLQHICRSFTALTLVFNQIYSFHGCLVRYFGVEACAVSAVQRTGAQCVCVISRQAAGCNGNIANIVQHHVIHNKNDDKDALNSADR